MIPFQNACTIGPESFVYNCWTNPKNFFASKHTSVQGFLAQAQEDATLLTFATKFPSQPPALLVLLFRKLWNFQLYQNLRLLASSLLSHMPTWCHAFWQQISKLSGNTHSSQNKLVGLPLSQNPHKVFICQSLCLGQSFATQNVVSTRPFFWQTHPKHKYLSEEFKTKAVDFTLCIVIFTRPYLNICLDLNICPQKLPPQDKNLLRFDCATATICSLWHMELHISTSVTKPGLEQFLRRDPAKTGQFPRANKVSLRTQKQTGHCTARVMCPICHVSGSSIV